MKRPNNILLCVLCCLACSKMTWSQAIHWQNRPCWDAVELLGDDLLKVKQAAGWGVIRFDGTPILPCHYAQVTRMNENKFLVLGDDDKLLSIGDVWGNIVSVSGDWYIDKAWPYFTNGLLAVRNTQGLWGYMDDNNQLVIKNKFKNAFPFFYGLAAVCENEKRGWYHIDKAGNIAANNDGFIHNKKLWFASSYTKINDGLLASVILINDKVFFIDVSGNLLNDVIPKEGANFVEMKDNDVFYCSKGGSLFEFGVNPVLELSYINYDGKRMDCRQKEVEKFLFPNVTDIVIEETGKMIIGGFSVSPQFQEAIPLSSKTVLVKKDGKWGILRFDADVPVAKVAFMNQRNLSVEHSVVLPFELSGNKDNIRVYAIDNKGNRLFLETNAFSGDFVAPIQSYTEKKEAVAVVGLEMDGILLEPETYFAKIRWIDGFKVTGPSNVKVDKEGHASFHISVFNKSTQKSAPFEVRVDNGRTFSFGELQSQDQISVRVGMTVSIPAIEDFINKTIKVSIAEEGIPTRSYPLVIRFEREYKRE